MKKLGLWLMTICLLACLSFATVACDLNSESGAKDKVELNETSVSLEVYSEYTLTATTNVKGEVTWSSSDESVATVAGGKVSALKVGSATITATAGKASATCEVTVTALSVLPVLEVSADEIQLVVGDEPYEVTASVTFKGETQDCQISWESENADVATVANGAITAEGVGSTTITATAVCLGETLVQEISVTVSPDEYIMVSEGVMDLKVAEVNDEDITSDVFTATAYVNGAEDGDKEILFRSNDENVATVVKNGNQATVTAVGVGSTTIEAYYQSENGKIVSTVSVTVSRSQVELSESLSTPYAGADTVLDLSALELQGDIEGVYFGGSRIDLADNKLDETFVEANKDTFIEIEIRTSAVSYTAQFIITVPFVAEVSQGAVGVPMPVYEGDETALGFAEGTTVYELVTTRKYTKDAESDSYLHCEEETHVDENGYHTHVDGWDTRMITTVGKAKDYVKFDVVFSKDVGNFTMWPSNNETTLGSYSVYGQSVLVDSGADPDRKILVLNEKGKTVSTFKANTIYTVYFFLNRGENNVQFGLFTDITAYVANIDCGNGDVNEKEPDPISQGDDRNTMPIFAGDETALGFADGTTVYEIVGPKGNDVKLVAKVDAMTYDYAKLDFVVTANTSSVGVWITAENSHLGYYTVTPTGFTADGYGDPSRDIFVTDKDGNAVTSFNANTVYTLYIGFDGREITVQLSTWDNLTMYVANVACISASELPSSHTPPTVTPGEEISILFIGNSFSDDTEAYVVDILLELGYTTINVGNMYIGGCTIDMHYSNIMSNASAYDFRMRTHNGVKYTEYVPVSVGGRKQTLDFAIGYKDWDIISLQQGSALSGKADSYANLSALKAEVQNRATNPDVEFVFNMTWAYQGNSTHENFPDYDSNQTTMYNAIVDAVQQKVDFTVVPNGTAIQNARSSFVGDTLTLDGHHLSLKLGRYIAGLTFVAKVTGKDISDIAYAPSGVTESQKLVAIESVKNALTTPYAVTTSAYAKDPYAIPSDSLIQSFGTSGSVTVYNGDETALGFADGSDVYQYVGEDSGIDMALIKVDGSYDFVDVQLVITEGSGYFWMYGYSNGTQKGSYIIDPSWIRQGDNTTASDRKIEIYDANGNKYNTGLFALNTLYTLRVYTQVGELDEILISMTGSTIYFANVTYGNVADLVFEHVVKQGDERRDAPTFDGDETTLGFEADTTVYVVEEVKASEDDNIWNYAWNDRAIIYLPQAQDYVVFEFVMGQDVTAGSIFHVWGVRGAPSIGQISSTTGLGEDWAVITDMDGYAITSLTAGTHYLCYIACEDLEEIQVALIEFNTFYFANITTGEGSLPTPIAKPNPDPDPDPNPDPEPQAPIVSGEATSTALSKYAGDVTELGFAEGTTVYELVSGDSSWNDRVKIAVDNSQKYLDVDFVVTEGTWYFIVWLVKQEGMLGGQYLVNENVGGFAQYTTGQGLPGGNTRIQVLDKGGNVVTGVRLIDTIYTLRVYLEDEDLTEVHIGQSNTTICFANINCNSEEPEILLMQGEGEGKRVLPVYTGESATLGFTAGEKLQYMATETLEGEWWNSSEPTSGKKREQLAVCIPGEVGKYVTIQFSTNTAIESGSVFYVWGLLGSVYTKDGGVNFTATDKGRILDLEGNLVSSISANTVYVLELYIENSDTYKVANIATPGMETYFATETLTYSTKSVAVQLPGAGDLVQSTGTNKNAVTIYTGDETALGFAQGSTVYKYVGVSDSADKFSVKVDYTYDYVEFQLVVTEGDTWFWAFVKNGGNYLNGGQGYVLDPSNLRFGNGDKNLDRVIKVFDANGEEVNTLLSANVRYTVRFYVKAGNVEEIQMRQTGVTYYLANVTYGNDPVVPKGVEIKVGDEKADPELYEYPEDYGFEEGTQLYAIEFGADATVNKAVVLVDENADYLTIDFALEIELLANLQIWTVTDGGEAVLVAEISADGSLISGDGVVVIKDAEGNDVTGDVIVSYEKYTLCVYYEGADEIHISCTDEGNLIYLANATCGEQA